MPRNIEGRDVWKAGYRALTFFHILLELPVVYLCALMGLHSSTLSLHRACNVCVCVCVKSAPQYCCGVFVLSEMWGAGV